MSNMNNNNNNNQVPLQPLLPQGYMNNQRRGRGMYWGNQYNYPNNNNQFYRRNTYYNRNYQQGYNGYDNGGYGITNAPPPQSTFYGPQRRFNQNRPRSHSGQQRSGPRQIRLNDFMPSQLRNVSPSIPNLPTDFNLLNNGPTTNNGPPIPVPSNALPQRANFQTQTITTNNTTQPFNINDPTQQQQQSNNGQNQRQQATTTAGYRRRNRRNRQQQYRQNPVNNNNRFAAAGSAAFDQGESTDLESNYDDQNDAVPLNNDQQIQKQNKKKKQRLYLEPSRIMRYMQDNSSTTISGRGNQAFVLATTSIYDEWVRHNYELQVWQTYLKMGTENKHWAKEVIQRTKKRDIVTCTKFVQRKINQLLLKIGQASASISDLQIQLGTYWTQAAAGSLTSTSTTTTSNTNRARDPVDRVEKSILKYIQHCTQHVKKMAEIKIQLAKAQMEEFKALEDFHQIATPLQWNIHLTLKPKLKTWSIKNKNYRTATKRVEYDLPPKFISKTEFNFKLDESILCPEEAQALYDQMRQVTKEYRTQAMTLYIQATTREYELLSNEINQIIKGFPQENDDGFDAEPGFASFKHYNELREKRFNLEANLSIYFLDEQRVEGEMKDQEEIVAPTLTRTLGEDFSLQP
jgi:hypothetical protein